MHNDDDDDNDDNDDDDDDKYDAVSRDRGRRDRSGGGDKGRYFATLRRN